MTIRGPSFVLAAISLFTQYAASAEVVVPGATVPWITLEAEQTRTNGRVLGPDYAGQTPVREASGRRCVRLASTGQFLEFKASADAQGLVVRYCIPDSPDGVGIDVTLGLYINGKFLKKLPMTSRYSHLYGRYPFDNKPSSGTPRNFWDEVRLMPGSIHKGDAIKLQKDADDSAAEYLIDFIDLETVPPALQRPDNSLSITDFGAKPDVADDARPAFAAAISAAKSQKKTVWIPSGVFVVKGSISVSDVMICGAGMWYSTLAAVEDYKPNGRVSIQGAGSNVTLADFAMVGKLNYRNDAEGNDGIGGSFGTGSIIRYLWIEHTKTGAWLVNSDGLVVEGCRFRNTIADGINLCVGMHNTTVRNCTARGTGDDCFAIWPATYIKSKFTPGENHFVHCTAQLPFLAQAFSIYGGDSNSVEDCLAIDIPYGAGLFASTTFASEFGFRGTTVFHRNKLLRAGGGDGAIATVANLIDLAGLHFEDIEVTDSATDGIKFNSMNKHALRDTSFERIKIINPGTAGAGRGVAAGNSAVGSATIANVSVVNPKTRGLPTNAPDFKLVQSGGNSGI